VDFAATDTVMATATIFLEATLQAAAPKLHCAVAERDCEVLAVVPTTTAARWVTLLLSARISSGKGPLPPRSSREKPRPSDARFGVAGPYCC
jgi:hypothetical protein